MNKEKTKTKSGIRKSGKINPKNNILLYNRKGETRIYLILSFLLPFVIMWFFFAKSEVHPFGDKQILVTDLWHQYYPFFRVEHEKLQNLSSLLYSWDTGLGTNFISLMSYYAASPLNFLAVFFPIEYSRDALTLFLTIKIGCAGLFFAIFLKHTFNKNDISITAFALCFALCNYFMGYYWNIIWMDTVALLPLVVLGTVKLYKEGKFRLYAISLALSLMTSFYIGLFTCIFTVMVFGALVIIDWGGIKNAFKRLGQIAGATVIGIGMGTVILLPAFLGLMLTNSVDNQFPQDITFYEPWLKMISSVIGFHEPTAKEGLPNYYCGMFAVILLGVFIRSRKVKIREKIVTVIYLAFIIVSCNMNVLNYMWHGFHFTNMLPYRFSFLLSFILLAAGYRAFIVMKEEASIFDVIAMSAMTFIIALVAYRDQTEKALISSVVVCFIFVAIMFVYERKLINEKVLNLAVFAVCFVEMGMNAALGVKTVTVTGYSIYPRKNEAISGLIDSVDENDSGFYRLETTTNYTINDPALYGYRGVSQFSSTANVNVTKLMHGLGLFASSAGNRYYYNQNTAVVNMFLNLKYLISSESYSGDLTYLDPLAEKDGASLYQNNHYLPIGFAADSSILDYDGESFMQFENQNELFKKATGIDEDVLVRVDIKDVGHKGLNVIKSGYGNYNFQYNAPSDGSSDCYL
ncbi:MAG: YfhO family protein, partial [Porcipelethomonas sp.]